MGCFKQPSTWAPDVIGDGKVNDENKPDSSELSRPQVTNLVDSIQYQDGSVVSREIIKKKTGTLTLFAFDAGQGLSEHTAPFDAAVYVLDGKVEVTIAGEPSQVGRGEMIIMPADRPHALKAVERFKMLLVMIR
jgi:quercetin dioxygenase-like cupin family protein